MRHRLVHSKNLAINTAVITYFEIENKNHNFTEPDHKTLKFIQKSIVQKLKGKYPQAKQTDIDDFLYLIFRQIVKADQTADKLFPRISPRDRRPLLATLFAKYYKMEQVCGEINNYWFFNGTYSNKQIEKMTFFTIMMLEKACFLDGKNFCDNMEEECADFIKQIIPPKQWLKLAQYAVETLNTELCQLLRDHFGLHEKEQDKLEAVLVVAKLIEQC